MAAITAIPPPCGVGTVCDERAFGLASAMRCSQGRIATMIARLIAAAKTKTAAAAIAPMLAARLNHRFTHRSISLPRAASDFPRPYGHDQPEIVQECLPIDAGIEKADLPAEETALPRSGTNRTGRDFPASCAAETAQAPRHACRSSAGSVHATACKAADAVAQPGIGADDVFAMHPVAHLRNLIVVDLAAGAAGQQYVHQSCEGILVALPQTINSRRAASLNTMVLPLAMLCTSALWKLGLRR